MNYSEMRDNEIIRAYRNGDLDAIDFLIRKYTPLIHKCKSNRFAKGYSDDDFVQEGYIGLMSAINKYDEDAKASFFLVGKHITEETAPIVRRAVSLGCEICCHSFAHDDMSRMTPAEIHADFDETARRIQAITDTAPRFFRPPYIAVSEVMFSEIPLPFIAGYGVTDYEDTVTADMRFQGVMSQAKHNAIILLHDQAGNIQTVEALKQIIPALRAEGYEFVTVSQLFAEAGITPQKRILYSFSEQTTMYAE